MLDSSKGGAALLLALCTSVLAAGGTPASAAAWPHPGLVLSYRSCGCGDDCWTAEVIALADRSVPARLHCDCERLSFDGRPGASAGAADLGSCEAINASPDKQAAIRGRLEALVRRD